MGVGLAAAADRPGKWIVVVKYVDYDHRYDDHDYDDHDYNNYDHNHKSYDDYDLHHYDDYDLHYHAILANLQVRPARQLVGKVHRQRTTSWKKLARR